MTQSQTESRRSRRTRRSDAVLWRPVGRDAFQIGCMLESSEEGVAFAWRGDIQPSINDLIELHRDLPKTGTPQRAIVRRVTLAHDNLCVVGAQIQHVRPLPPRAARALAEVKPRNEVNAMALHMAA